MRRAEGIAALIERIGDAPIVASLGPSTFDLYAAGDRPSNLYTWGAMGLASSIGLGVALGAPDRRVFVTDGDGSLLMNLGSLATIARQGPANLVHIVWDNHMWAETGGQPTHTATGTDLAGIARAAGIPQVATVSELNDFNAAIERALTEPGPWCIVVEVEEAGRAGRPTVHADENFLRFSRTFTR